MCMMVYIASDYPLPTLAWNDARPGFHITDLMEAHSPVRRRFSKPYAYYVGSHEGCGCGFQVGQYAACDEDATALAAGQSSRRLLVDFLKVALQHQQTVELFACWDGDQGAEPEHRTTIGPQALLDERTYFLEREWMLISELGA
jgi:hypothetical protein